MPDPQTAPKPCLKPLTCSRSSEGRLFVGGCDVTDLARIHGTPLYIVDEQDVRVACRRYQSALKVHYPGASRVLFASKSHCTMAIAALVHQEGLGLDVVSAGEMMTALKAGVPASALVMQGNNKPRGELVMGLEAGVGRINVDNLDELDAVLELTESLGVTTKILLRVAPGIEAHTHEFIQTGKEDSKFGLDLGSGQLDQALVRLASQSRVQWLGLQAHIGSQIFDVRAFEEAAAVMVRLLAEVRERYGVVAAELDLGGGLGIVYEAQDAPPAIEEAVAAIARAVVAQCEKWQYPLPALVLEPGRSIIGTAGITAYRVGYSKVVPGIRRYVMLDGGMADNPRPITYGAVYQAELAERETGTPERVTLAGRYCESGDVLIKDALLPSPQAGETVVVYGTGAYNHSMASTYNRCGRPAMVLVRDGVAVTIVERESLDDLMRLDRLPAHLKAGG